MNSLLQTVVSTRLAKPRLWKIWPGACTRQARLHAGLSRSVEDRPLQWPASFARLRNANIAHDFPIMTIQGPPQDASSHSATSATGDMRHAHRPPLFFDRPGSTSRVHVVEAYRTLMDQPPLLLQHVLHHLLVSTPLCLVPQERGCRYPKVRHWVLPRYHGRLS